MENLNRLRLGLGLGLKFSRKKRKELNRKGTQRITNNE